MMPSLAADKVAREARQFFDAVGRDEVVLFETNPGFEVLTVQAGFHCDDIALFEDRVVVWIQLRALMSAESNAVTKMMDHAGKSFPAEILIGQLE